MSNYLPFQEEQSFQGATFKIDSPSKPKREFYSDDYNKKYINKKFYPEHKEITKRSELNTQNPSIYVEKSMHHQEIRLNGYLII